MLNYCCWFPCTIDSLLKLCLCCCRWGTVRLLLMLWRCATVNVWAGACCDSVAAVEGKEPGEFCCWWSAYTRGGWRVCCCVDTTQDDVRGKALPWLVVDWLGIWRHNRRWGFVLVAVIKSKDWEFGGGCKLCNWRWEWAACIRGRKRGGRNREREVRRRITNRTMT